MIETNKIICGDALEELEKLSDNSIDLVLISPPYDNIEGSGYSKGKKDVLFLKLYSEFLDRILKELYRVLKPTGQFYLNLKHSTLKTKLKTCHWIEFLEGFQKFDFKSYIIWKYSGSFDSTFKRFHLDYEIIYHLSKSGDIKINLEDNKDPLTSVWYIPHYIKERLHPVQMPIKVAEKIISCGSNEEEVVLDCFMGAGTTALACKYLKRKYIGIEINPEYCKVAEQRLKGGEND